MKSKTHILLIGCMFILAASLNSSAQSKYFDSAEEAVQQAKTDLMTILEKGTAFDFDISAEKLKKAESSGIIPFMMIDFAALMNTDSLQKFSDLRNERLYYLAPMLAGNEVVAVLQINKDEKGWIMGGLLNKNLRSALNHIPVEFRKGNMKQMMIYEVPNIHAVLYVAKMEDEAMIFTDYKDMYTLKRPVEIMEVFRTLRSDAIEFQRLHGDKVKEQKLVK